eukprot:7475996-Pyramimonas_sp.AAC.1
MLDTLQRLSGEIRTLIGFMRDTMGHTDSSMLECAEPLVSRIDLAIHDVPRDVIIMEAQRVADDIVVVVNGFIAERDELMDGLMKSVT